jgi:quinolinate synthase
MVKEGKIQELREKYNDLAVVCYINSSIELKKQSDVCVTSSNAVKIVKALPNKNIFFIPDENLGRHVAEQVPEKNVILNDGFCPKHKQITAEQVLDEKKKHPNALVLVHPECVKSVLDLADYIGSTQGIIGYAKESCAKEFIICTEVGVLYQLKINDPEKTFYFTNPCPICHDMKLNTLENIIEVLQTGKNEVLISDFDREKALLPLNKMLELGK